MAERMFSCDEGGLVASRQFMDEVCCEPRPSVIFDEIVSNIVRCSGGSRFSVAIGRVPGGYAMRFADDGKAFDPLHDAPVPDVSASLEERQVGGLGLFMVRKMAKSISYERKDGSNVLSLTV